MFLEVRNLKKEYLVEGIFTREKKVILNDVSFFVPEGEVLSIVGESGAGKSTIGQIILQIKRATSGEIIFMGKPLCESKISDIQMIFQDPYSSLNPAMKIKDILAEPLRGSGIKNKNILEEKVDNIMKEVWLEESYKNKYPSELSGGQRQRVGIGAAMILNPKLVVCDEPVASLDLSIQNQILSLLKKFNRENNTTIIFISHDLGVVYNISDRVLLLYKGEVQEIQKTENFFKNPKSEYGKYFLDGVLVP
ncbi:MAG: ATP-binding cassette domain-containing protein [Fusobacteriaceae bacterium]|jgi:ABC-type glutathione transport system ATPase component|nr:ATP-binding cassette domain-containing protein [Fusobacteriaceae bacterium]